MVEKGKFYYETRCPDCERFHSEPLLRPGGHPESSIAYCHVGGSRTEVTIDYEAAIKLDWLIYDRAKTVPDRAEQVRQIVDAALVEGGNQ